MRTHYVRYRKTKTKKMRTIHGDTQHLLAWGHHDVALSMSGSALLLWPWDWELQVLHAAACWILFQQLECPPKDLGENRILKKRHGSVRTFEEVFVDDVPMLFGDNHAGRKCVFIWKLRYTTTILMIIIPITMRSTISTFSTRTIIVSRTKGAAFVCCRNDLIWQMQPETRSCYVRCCKTKTKKCAPFMEPFDARLLWTSWKTLIEY
jgi:hypothetical protein